MAPSKTFLNIDNCVLKPNSLKYITNRLLINDETLREIYFNNKCLDECDVIKIAKTLHYNTQLKILKLIDVDLSINSVIEIANALRVNNTLEELDIRWNKISYRGARLIFSALRKNVGLKKLNMSGIGMGSFHGSSLAKMLKHNKSLQKLDVSWNLMDQSSVVEIIHALDKNVSLESLYICGNDNLELVAAEIEKMLKHNHVLKKIDIVTTQYYSFSRKYAFLRDLLHSNVVLVNECELISQYLILIN